MDMPSEAKTAETWARELLDAAQAPYNRVPVILPLIYRIRAEGERIGLREALSIAHTAQDAMDVYDQIMRKLANGKGAQP